ncbi:MAG: lactate utilization protein, partial [Chthoniobacterales bacterium]|nr:lactate utilization protein [Chthoniobacterales bacterium]
MLPIIPSKPIPMSTNPQAPQAPPHDTSSNKQNPEKLFHTSANHITRNLHHRSIIQKALGGYYLKRDEQKARFSSWQNARTAAASIKYEAINHLDHYLVQFADKIEANGAKVFWASDGSEALQYILAVARQNNVRRIIKSKTMTGEEIHLSQTLANEGYEVVESDLGEFIVQLRQEPPYHIVFPAMHLTRGEISSLFQQKLGSPPSNEPEELTMIARAALRQKYLQADMGISGANFAIAETGMISITENEGNARLSVGLPPIHVVILGIEKIVPRLQDLALLLPMLATAGAGQHLTGYNTLISGPRKTNEPDGPEQMHVILLDNRRTTLLADAEQRDALHCIRCGACLNVCPIFKNIGGHSYGTTYQGPIGSVITPHLRDLQTWKHLSAASSLCGACSETCPVKIDLHHHLLHNRRNAYHLKPNPLEKILWFAFNLFMQSPFLYNLAAPLNRLFTPFFSLLRKT